MTFDQGMGPIFPEEPEIAPKVKSKQDDNWFKQDPGGPKLNSQPVLPQGPGIIATPGGKAAVQPGLLSQPVAEQGIKTNYTPKEEFGPHQDGTIATKGGQAYVPDALYTVHPDYFDEKYRSFAELEAQAGQRYSSPNEWGYSAYPEMEFRQKNTPDERDALRSYKGSSYTLNRILHENANGIKSQDLTVQMSNIINRLTQTLERHTTPEDLEVVRAVRPERLIEWLDKQPGDEFVYPQFASTHLDHHEAERMGSDYGWLHIGVPKGTQGLYIEHLTMEMGENEFLLQRGTKFRITGHESVNGQPHIYVEVVAQNPEDRLPVKPNQGAKFGSSRSWASDPEEFSTDSYSQQYEEEEKQPHGGESDWLAAEEASKQFAEETKDILTEKQSQKQKKFIEQLTDHDMDFGYHKGSSYPWEIFSVKTGKTFGHFQTLADAMYKVDSEPPVEGWENAQE